MLVLARKRGESIIINHNIRVTAVDIDRGQVRLGIDAPKEIPVHREEVEKQIQAQESEGGQ